ncbi:hypothetical protein [uncultured Rhodoblastus sp.]|uniref:hypothetical protein n=1 Tax=uncultured Rhodoblastus sp. TaxID=543037 RepID=UPI0025F274B3|nr:hypothetical protein [uncultured Rhodoblastus sp.]
MQWKNPDGSQTSGIVIEDGAGNKLGTAANPLNIAGGGGGGGGSNASVGTLGSSVPASATALGFQNGSGNLAVPSPYAGLPIADSGAAITGASMPTGGVGLTGWLSAILSKLSGTLAISVASLPLPTGAATAANQPSLVTTSAGGAGRSVVADPTTGLGANVAAFHNADNQALGTVYGILTGGVDQLVNSAGNLDRKRGVSGDAMAITGLAAEVPMIFNGSSYDRLRSVSGDAASATGIVQEAVALWNGLTYDRWYGDKTNGAFVNVKQLPALPAGANTIGAISNASFGAKAQDGGGTALTSTLINAKQRLDVALAAGAVPGASAPSYADVVGGVDGGGLARQLLTDTSGRLAANINSLPALAAGSNIIGYAGSLNFGPLLAATAPTVNLSSAYASGKCIGSSTGTAGQSAIFALPVFRNTTQPSATLTQLLGGFLSGQAGQITAYLFTRNPTNSTSLTDGATPAFAAADLKYLACPPITFTPVATVGSVQTIGSFPLSLPVQNNDSSATVNLYLVMVYSGGSSLTFTSGQQNDLWFSLSGVKD